MLPTDRDTLIKRHIEARLPYPAIAKAHGISRQTVHNIAKRLNVESTDAYVERILRETMPRTTVAATFDSWEDDTNDAPTMTAEEYAADCAKSAAIVADWGTEELSPKIPQGWTPNKS